MTRTLASDWRLTNREGHRWLNHRIAHPLRPWATRSHREDHHRCHRLAMCEPVALQRDHRDGQATQQVRCASIATKTRIGTHHLQNHCLTKKTTNRHRKREEHRRLASWLFARIYDLGTRHDSLRVALTSLVGGTTRVAHSCPTVDHLRLLVTKIQSPELEQRRLAPLFCSKPWSSVWVRIER